VLEQGTRSTVRGFNNANEVVGGTIGFGRDKRAFLLRDGRARKSRGLPGTDARVAIAITDDSTAVGSSAATMSTSSTV
jgi:hypothetical protein